MLNLIGFIVFCGFCFVAFYFQSADSTARNRFPPTADLALGDVFVAVNSLQDLLDNVDLRKLDYAQAQSIRSAQFKVEAAISAYAKQPEYVR